MLWSGQCKQQPAHCGSLPVSNEIFHRNDSLTCEWMYLALFVWTGEGVVRTVVFVLLLLLSGMLFNGINSIYFKTHQT
jgi:hypothetical protein